MTPEYTKSWRDVTPERTDEPSAVNTQNLPAFRTIAINSQVTAGQRNNELKLTIYKAA